MGKQAERNEIARERERVGEEMVGDGEEEQEFGCTNDSLSASKCLLVQTVSWQ